MKLFKTRAKREQELREWFIKNSCRWCVAAIPHLIDYILKGDEKALERAQAINKRDRWK